MGDIGGIRPVALRRQELSVRQRRRRLQVMPVGFQRRHAAPAQGGTLFRSSSRFPRVESGTSERGRETKKS